MKAVYGDFVTTWFDKSTSCFFGPSLADPTKHEKIPAWVAKEPSAKYNQYFVVLQDTLHIRKLVGNLEVSNDTCSKFGLPPHISGYNGFWLPESAIAEVDTQHFKINDTIEIRVENGTIMSPTGRGRIEAHKVIGLYPDLSNWELHYAMLWPNGSMVNNGLMLEWHISEEYRAKSFRSVKHTYVVGSAKNKHSANSGMSCMNRFCKEQFPYADGPNCPNNVFMCYSCRHNPVTYLLVMNERSANA